MDELSIRLDNTELPRANASEVESHSIIDRIVSSSPVPADDQTIEGIDLHTNASDIHETLELKSIAEELRPGTPSRVEISETVSEVKGLTREVLVEKIQELLISKQDDDVRLQYLSSLVSKEVRRMSLASKLETAEQQNESKSKAMEIDYENELALFHRSWKELKAAEIFRDANTSKLQSELDAARQVADTELKRLARSRKNVVSKSRFSKTGKRIDASTLEKFEQIESSQIEQMLVDMKETAILRSRLRKLNSIIKQKETLADGLHLIDFEQMKIENLSLTEKIEDRALEHNKLSQKRISVIHTLAHIQQKLEFMRANNQSLKKNHEQLQERIIATKNHVPGMKKQRDLLRQESQDLRAKCGLLIHRPLLEDFEKKYDKRGALEAEVMDLRSRYETLNLAIEKRKIPTPAKKNQILNAEKDLSGLFVEASRYGM